MKRSITITSICAFCVLFYCNSVFGQVQQPTKLGELTKTESNESARDGSAMLELKLYPNPASKMVELNPGTGLDRSGKLSVYNQIGVVVISDDWRGEKLDISNLPQGMYIVTLKRGELTFFQKLIIKK